MGNVNTSAMVSYPKKTSAEWFIEQLNVENAKLLAFVLVLGFIGYHGILHLRYGKFFVGSSKMIDALTTRHITNAKASVSGVRVGKPTITFYY